MKVTTWAIVALLVAGGIFAAVRPAQGCPGTHAATHAPAPVKPAGAPSGHRSFIIAARMGWL